MGRLKSQAKPFEISKWEVKGAWGEGRANKGAAGVDGESIDEFEKDLRNNLYKVWNRMSSGSYFPSPVCAVEIPKPHGGGMRMLAIPRVADRVAQTVVARHLMRRVDPISGSTTRKSGNTSASSAGPRAGPSSLSTSPESVRRRAVRRTCDTRFSSGIESLPGGSWPCCVVGFFLINATRYRGRNRCVAARPRPSAHACGAFSPAAEWASLGRAEGCTHHAATAVTCGVGSQAHRPRTP